LQPKTAVSPNSLLLMMILRLNISTIWAKSSCL
jgi:hypothetical protein